MTLLWLILITELKIALSNPQSGNASEMTSVWTYNCSTLSAFLDYLNNIDSIGKIVANGSVARRCVLKPPNYIIQNIIFIGTNLIFYAYFSYYLVGYTA